MYEDTLDKTENRFYRSLVPFALLECAEIAMRQTAGTGFSQAEAFILLAIKKEGFMFSNKFSVQVKSAMYFMYSQSASTTDSWSAQVARKLKG